MRAVEFREFGEPSQLHVVDRPDPHAGASSAVVRVEAASINPSDVKNVAGRMQQTTLPRVPGRDYSGVVLEGPAEWLGVPVWGTGGDTGFTRDGTHAQLLEVPVASLVRKPDYLTHEQAASLGVTFLTAWLGIVDYAGLVAGETLAVIGASGGVGSAAIQIATHLGAQTIAIGRGDDPAESAHSADVVLDAAGLFEVGLALLRHRGRMVAITPGKERRVNFDITSFYRNESQLFGVDSLKRDLTEAAVTLRKLAPGFESGAYLAPPIAHALPLDQVREAYEFVSAGSSGRVVLRPW